MPTGEFFLEIRCEEIPARMLAPGVRDLATHLFEELIDRRLAPGEVSTTFTPRRLLVTLRGLEATEPDREEEVTGPPASVAYDAGGSPTAALLGFARKCGVPAEELYTVDTSKGEYLAATHKTIGRPTPEVLAALVPRILERISWPRTMRWGDGDGPWVRPIHSIVALFEGEVVDFELFDIRSGRTTVGHPLHSPTPFEVTGSEDHSEQLARRSIVVDFESRREVIRQRMEEKAVECGGSLVPDDALLDKLASICEVPGIVLGRIDGVELPREVLIASLRDHQSALTIERDSELLPYFLTVMDRPDDPSGRVERGNEWVVAARLDDARFFLSEDRKRNLEERRADLERVTFHEKLGSYAAKTERIVALSEWLCRELGWEETISSAAGAARLLKVDLTTEMVKEFTSLQGVIGGVYAREEGLEEAVWQGIYDQYLPTTAADSIPGGRVGRIVSLADRLDTLVGMFGCGFAPTGSKDPFGLRRAAQGAVRIVLEADLALDLERTILETASLYENSLQSPAEDILSSLKPFILDRVRYLLGRDGYAHDEIEASLAVPTGRLSDHPGRVEALHSVRREPSFLDVVLSAKRIANILRRTEEHTLDETRLVEPAERALFEAATALGARLDETEAARAYDEGLRSIAGFAEVLDRFFIEVLVMDEDPAVRANRLALLQQIERILSRAAGLTEMVVERADRQNGD